MDAELLLISARGRRTVPLNLFFTGPGRTVLAVGELVAEVSIPPFKGRTAFVKLGRRKTMTLAVVNAAARIEPADSGSGVCTDVRIAVGAMAPTPLRCTKAENILKGKVLDRALLAAAAAQAVEECSPIDDGRASAWYRKKAGAAVIASALAQASGMDLYKADLTKHFGGLSAVESLSFSIREGEILGILGPNGAGKTTVFNMIAGKLRHTRGEILFMGKG